MRRSDDDLPDEANDDPNDPRHPDYDLSESVPYSSYEPGPKPWFNRRWLLIIIAVLAIGGLVLPYVRDFF